MSFDVDPRFKSGTSKSRQRKVKRRVRKVGVAGLGLAGLAGLAGIIWLVFLQGGGPDTPPGGDTASSETGADDDFTLTQMASSADEGIIAVRAAFIDIAKEPMILRIDSSGREEDSQLAGPAGLDAARVGTIAATRLTLVRDDLVLLERQLVTTIPSSREDLAYFQAQRSKGLTETATVPPADPIEAEAGDTVTVDGAEGSWGELIQGAEDGTDTAVADTATYVETKIENTTSVALLLRESDRAALFEDKIVVLQTERTLGDVLGSVGLDDAGVAAAVAAATRLMPDSSTALPPGAVVAARLKPDLQGPQLLQLSIYRNDGYLGTLAQIGAGRYETGADPWINEDLLGRSDEIRATVQSAPQDVRLLDAIYSAAIRNGLSTTMVGELIVMMSQGHDLDRYAAVGDRLTLLFATEPGPDGGGSGQFLFAGVRGPSGTIDCYVVKDAADGSYSCYTAGAGGGGGGAGGMGGGLIVPVSGTRTSGFGPRMHPILRQLRNHNGVDWAAPTGTPIHAAADGVISSKRLSDSFGNVIYIDHPGGRQTRYAHMSQFAEGIAEGQSITAGTLIGYVGTTGRSTGPHLHFEYWVNEVAADPLSAPAPANSGGTVVVAAVSGPGSDAVEALVNQIIAVESGGRTDAANPNSSAVGLGQFIKSTWLRMMETYRPDLVQSMSEADLLALRTNGDLSREMVRNLARENEAFLRQRGHTITAGRLYLAHFLGPGGADKALGSDPGMMVIDAMGPAVVGANGFLAGKTVGDLWAWADRKMGQTTSTPTTTAAAAPQVVPAEVKAYIDLIDPIITES